MRRADKLIIVTLGDPGGIGPELAVRVFGAQVPPKGRFLLIGLESALKWHAARLNLPMFWARLGKPDLAGDMPSGIYLYEPPGLPGNEADYGQASRFGGLVAGKSLDSALELIQSGASGTLLTLPLCKATLNEAGFNFPGHTEFLAERSGVGGDNVCMHLYGQRLRVSLVTTHPCLADVPKLVSKRKILHCLKLTAGLAARLKRPEAAIAVCGLNPHAGECGLIGNEEVEIIAPAVAQARALGINAQGPFPGDTVFHRAAAGEFWAVLAMYHDQGLAPFKLMHFGEGVNVTLGLPFVRVSVDHGTAFELVGQNKAKTDSLNAALSLALKLD